MAVLTCSLFAQAATITITCRNATGDSDAINLAIRRSGPGDELVIQGTCALAATIELRGERSYRGDSRAGTRLKQADGANLRALLASDSYLSNTTWTGRPIELRRMTLDGNRRGNPREATDCLVLRSWQTTIEALNVFECGGAGIRITNLSANKTALTNSQVNGRIADLFVSGTGGHGIHIQDTGNAITDWNLVENWIGHSEGDAVHLENAAGWVVERNHIYGVGGNGIHAHRLFGSSISNNYIEDFGRNATPAVHYGIWASIQGGAASVLSFNRVFNFKNAEKPGSAHVFLAIQSNYEKGLATLIGNTMRGTGGRRSTGMAFARTLGSELNVMSMGNVVMFSAQESTIRVVDEGVIIQSGH
jgi:hypothetical protein